MGDLGSRVRIAVKFFWQTRASQAKKQGSATGKRDQGQRSAVTGGAQMQGFADLLRDLLVDESGCPPGAVFSRKEIEVPGFFRAEKRWDLIVVLNGRLLAAIECKSQIGSFGNNYNNRSEEAIGNAIDFHRAHEEGIFRADGTPWLGYLVLLEDAPGSRTPVKVKEPHFAVAEDFRDASYAARYEVLLTRLVRERLYSGACLLLSSQEEGPRGGFSEPSSSLSFGSFTGSLVQAVKLSVKGGPGRSSGSGR